MQSKIVLTSAILLGLTSAAQSQEVGKSDKTSRIELWQGLSAGDTPETVAPILEKMPEIKRARVKGRTGKKRVSLKYQEDGIEVLDETFKVMLKFENDSLSSLALGSQQTCSQEMWQRWNSLYSVLRSKYPNTLIPPLQEHDLKSARLQAMQELSVTRSVGLTDGKTVVMQSIRFTHKERPPSLGYGASKAMRSLANILWSEYRSTAAECNGDGANRIQFMITYISKEKYDAGLIEMNKQDDEQAAEARSKL